MSYKTLVSVTSIMYILIADVYDLCDIEGKWHPYDNQCYKYIAEPRDWYAAKEYCMDQGGDLIVMETMDKWPILLEVIECTDFKRGIWLGLSDTVSHLYD